MDTAVDGIDVIVHCATQGVDLRGVGVMGTFDHTVNGEGSPGAPCVRIRGVSLWGSVGVRRKKRKTTNPALPQ